MHTPDLSLASSYIPACLCIFKSTVVFTLFLIAPVRGWIGICSLLVTDRVLWNRLNPILDVNAVAFALAGGLAITRLREHIVDSLFAWVVIVPWGLLTALQVLGVTRWNKSVEIIFAAMAISILSCMHQDVEIPSVLALRAFVFTIGNIVLSYLGIVLMDDFSDSYVHICRTLVLLLGEWRVSFGWLAVYLLCMGHQIRSKHCPAPEPIPFHHAPQYTEPACEIITPSKLLPPTPAVDEMGLLREALARKGKMTASHL